MDNRPDEAVQKLADEYWEARMKNEPLYATSLGDRRYDGKLEDITPAGRRRVMEEYGRIAKSARVTPTDGLSGKGRMTRMVLEMEAESFATNISCRLEEWTVDPLRGPQVELPNVESYQPVKTVAEGEAMVARWNAIGGWLDDHVANLRIGLGEGRVGVQACVEKVIEELDDLLKRPDSEWVFLRPGSEAHQGWTDAQTSSFSEGLAIAVRESVRPGFQRYLTFLKKEILPVSRPQDKPGVGNIPRGDEDYRKMIRFHTSLDLTPEELHQTGMSEVRKINGEMEALGERVFGTRNRVEVIKKLRSDKELYFETRDQVAEKAESALARAKAAIPRWFGRLPKADCIVTRMEEHEEKHSTIAYYRQPAMDGSRPGQYFINTYAPETRPRYEAEALAYHESIPGHHLQLAIAQEVEDIPVFRKNAWVTSFIEGWGLYTERLSDEMGLYTSDLDRIGVLSYDSWRACRLVVDTGMHALGWSRERAIDFMLENSALAKNNIVNEVDRYISWPGQALAYKVGQLEILRLREEAKKRLGNKFDIKKFHDAVLENGPIPLGALREVVSRLGN